MGAVPLTDPRLLALRCDQCGRYLAGIVAESGSWSLVWDLAQEHGWVGDGDPHDVQHCPWCVADATPPTPVSGQLQVRLRALDKIVVCRLADEVDVAVAGELRALLTFLSDRHLHIVLDLQALRLLDSKVLGILLRTRQALRRRGGILCLVAPSRLVLSLLSVLDLDRAFEVFETSDDAVRRLRRRGDDGA
jgi:anti-sigma B factor antagonist